MYAQSDAWVAVDELDRRTCPAASCGIVGQLLKNEQVTIVEEKDGWGRITIYYDAACKNGKSLFISKGSRSCLPENGIDDGKMAEWVKMADLTITKPDMKMPPSQAKYDLVRLSDDFDTYKNEFINAADSLIESGRCTREDFEKIGGWMSSSNYSNKPIYFIYCGGNEITNQVHLDASNGRIW